MFYPDSNSGTGTFPQRPGSDCSDEELDDTVRIREISFMTMYQREDSVPIEDEHMDEFDSLSKPFYTYLPTLD